MREKRGKSPIRRRLAADGAELGYCAAGEAAGAAIDDSAAGLAIAPDLLFIWR